MAFSSSRLPVQRSDPSAQSERAARLDAFWDASAVHAAITLMVLIDFLINVRQRSDYDALRLERLESGLSASREATR